MSIVLYHSKKRKFVRRKYFLSQYFLSIMRWCWLIRIKLHIKELSFTKLYVMKTFVLSLFLACCCFFSSNAQSVHIDIDMDEINMTISEVMDDLKETLSNIKLPEIDLSDLKIEIEEALPTEEEMEDIENEIRICLKEIEDIDFSELKEAMREVEEALKDLEIDIKIDEKSDKKQQKKKKDF